MKVLKNKIIAAVEDETGIQLAPEDLQLQAADNELQILLWDADLLTLEYESDEELKSEDFAEDLVAELFDEYYDLREAIVDFKIDYLNNKYLPEISETMIGKLKQNKIEKRILDVIDFEFIELTKDNIEFASIVHDPRGFPAIGLKITDFEELEHYIKLNAHKEPLVLDMDALTTELIKKIRGKI